MNAAADKGLRRNALPLGALLVLAFSPLAGHSILAFPRTGPELSAPENREISPYTGYTRRHWLEATEKLIAGVLPYFTSPSGMPVLEGATLESTHFDRYADATTESRMAFERSMVLSAFYTAATGEDRVPGFPGSISEPYRKAVILGTDPDSGFFWGQREVYDAFGTNIALAALVSPKYFWDPFTSEQKLHVLAFLKELAETRAYDCNHWFFHLIAVPLLERNGVTVDRDRLTRIFRRTLNWYRGDGWFIDGGNAAFDYYNLWGFQLYLNALMHFDQPWRERFGREVKLTTARFQPSFAYLFGRDGGPIPLGRSLTYRFAGISGLAWALINDSNTLRPGQARRIASGCLKYFWDRGCLSDSGLLEAGFHGPNAVVAEDYIDRGAVYWAAQAMALLLLPADHPFWTAREEPMPADEDGGHVALPGAEMVLSVSRIDGEAKAFPVGEAIGHVGSWQRGIKYFQHVYSSYLGWCALGEPGPDLGAGRTGVSYDRENWFFRTNPRAIQVDPRHIVSSYDLKLRNALSEFEDFGQLLTHTLIGEEGEIHIFWHDCAEPLFLWLGGYGISIDQGEPPEISTHQETISLDSGRYHSMISILEAPPGDLSVTHLKPVPGWNHAHLFGGEGAFPHWISRSPVPPRVPVIAWVGGARDRPLARPPIETRRSLESLSVEFDGSRFEIRLPY